MVSGALRLLVRVAIGGCGLALASAGPAAAHPHIWINAVATFLFEDRMLVGVRHHWEFDEMFGSYVIEEQDADGDGKMANDILFAGVVLVVAIAAGMAITMRALGVLSIVARNAVAARVDAGRSGRGRLAIAMDYAGALALTALGGGLSGRYCNRRFRVRDRAH